MSARRIRWVGIFAGVVLGVTAVAVAVSPAYAATCSTWGCDNTDPAVMGCSTNANNTATAYINNGAGQHLALVELRWSLTCRTNWGRITRQGNGNYVSISVYRASPYYNTPAFGGYASSYYGNQVYGYQMTACAVGQATDITNPQSPVYTVQICG